MSHNSVSDGGGGDGAKRRPAPHPVPLLAPSRGPCTPRRRQTTTERVNGRAVWPHDVYT